jgi:hypothetical protein
LLFSSSLNLQATSGDTSHLRIYLPSNNKTIGNILLFIKRYSTLTVLLDWHWLRLFNYHYIYIVFNTSLLRTSHNRKAAYYAVKKIRIYTSLKRRKKNPIENNRRHTSLLYCQSSAVHGWISYKTDINYMIIITIYQHPEQQQQ